MASNVYHPDHYEPDSAADIEVIIEGLPAAQGAALFNVLKYFERRNSKGNKADDLKKANNYAHRLVYGCWRDEGEAWKKSKISTVKTVRVLNADGISSHITAVSGETAARNGKPAQCGKQR